MVPLVRSTPLGVMLALLSVAACSAPDWPAVAGSSSGGASDSPETPASNAGTGIGPLPEPARTPPPGVSGSVGQEGAAPLSGGVSNLGGEADAGSTRPTILVDAGAAPTDASIEPPSAPDGPAEPEPEPECAGVRVEGVCWYLGAAELACDEVCASRGGFAPEGARIVGTPAQGGSIEGCTAVLEALDALPAPVTPGFRDDGLGLGCHIFTNATAATAAWWLDAPDLSPAASGIAVRIACSCVR
jgi:hypothetical protein